MMQDQNNTLITSAKKASGMSDDKFPKGILFFILVLSVMLMALLLWRH